MSDDPTSTVDLGTADERTLRLSVPQLTTEKLARLIAFQKQLLVEASTGEGSSLAQAYEVAAKANGFDRGEANELEAIVRLFAGHSWTLRRLRSRLEQLQRSLAAARAEGRAPSPKELAILEKLPAELRAKEHSVALRRRLGDSNFALLEQHEAELVALHEALGALLRR